MVTESITGTTLERQQKQNLLVTCASGSAGYATLKEFLSDDKFLQKFNIHCACYREAKKIKLELVSQLSGIHKCHMIDADNYDNNLAQPLKEADVVFLIPSNAKNRVQHVKNFVDAAKSGGNVKFIVLLSWLPASDGAMRSLFDRQFAEMERYIEESGIPYSFLRCGLFQQTLFLFAPDISKNVLPLCLREGRCAPLNVRDAARMAMCLFQNPKQHESKAYHITGPEVLSGQDMSMQISRALGREVRFVNVLPGNCRKLMVDSGLDEWMADAMVEVLQDIGDNKYAFETKDLVESLTGKSEIRLYDFFLSNSDRFTYTRPGEKVTETTAEALPSAERKARGEVKGKEGGAEEGKGKEEPGVAKIIKVKVVSRGEELSVAELERTKDTLQRWIFEQQSLISTLHDIVNRQEGRLLDFNRLADEVKEALWDSRHREEQLQQQQQEQQQQVQAQ